MSDTNARPPSPLSAPSSAHGWRVQHADSDVSLPLTMVFLGHSDCDINVQVPTLIPLYPTSRHVDRPTCPPAVYPKCGVSAHPQCTSNPEVQVPAQPIYPKSRHTGTCWSPVGVYSKPQCTGTSPHITPGSKFRRTRTSPNIPQTLTYGYMPAGSVPQTWRTGTCPPCCI